MSYIEQNAEEAFFRRQKKLLCRLEKERAPVIFDVGGNIGQSIAAYKELFSDAVITTFEPQEDCYDTLRRIYGGDEKVTLINAACAESSGTLPFFTMKCNTVSSLLLPDARVQRMSINHNYDYREISVPVVTLDSYCREKSLEKIDIVKIDVQGAELGVLKGGTGLLSAGAVLIFYIEVIFSENYQGQCDLTAITSLLRRFDYVLWDIRPFLYTRSGRLWTANAMYVSQAACSKLEEYPIDFPE